MPTPYRRAPTEAPVTDDLTREARWDDLVLGGLLIVLAGPRVVYAFLDRETFGAETTIAVIALALGLLVLSARSRR